MKTSQKQNILRHLLSSPLCSQKQDWTLGRRIPARIHELRQTGFQIGKRECDQGHDHRTYQVEFYLDVDDVGLAYRDCCADCGQPGALIFTGGPMYRPVGDVQYWLPVVCAKCGKGDWR